MRPLRNRSSAALAAAAAAIALVLPVRDTRAGCGCTKPAPLPAAVRPSVAWSDAEITISDPALVPGADYLVLFTSSAGESRPVQATAVLRRDLSDDVYKPLLPVTVPHLPLGPAEIRVRETTSGGWFLALPDDQFTVAPTPTHVPKGVGDYTVENYRAAVSRDGTVYVSLDFSDIQDARVFEARAEGYPLRFTQDDLVFYNVQGFLMQLLDATIPGLSSVDSGSALDSDLLRYSRHEFNTYFLQHDERQPHEVDASDPNYHLDGTPHIDHDLLVLEMDATLPGGLEPTPGATPPFSFRISVQTLFHHGIVGDASVVVDQLSTVDSYDIEGGVFGQEGDVLSNGLIKVENGSVVEGDATAASFEILSGGSVTGAMTPLLDPVEFLSVDVPSGLTDLGSLLLDGAETTLFAGSYLVHDLHVVNGGTLTIDNESGPVTIYVTGDVLVGPGSNVGTTDLDPEKFALYVVDGGAVQISAGLWYGVVYGPGANVEVDSGQFFGALVGADVTVDANAQVHYDAALSFDPCEGEAVPLLESLSDLTLVPGEWIEIDFSGIAPGSMVKFGSYTVPLPGGVTGWAGPLPTGFEYARNVPITIVSPGGCESPVTWVIEVDEPIPDLPECSDGIDNDEDGAVDYADDVDCDGPDDEMEAWSYCGFGAELVAVPPLLMWRARRRR